MYLVQLYHRRMRRITMTSSGVSAIEGTMLYGASVSTLQVLLDDPAEHDFASANHILNDLSEETARTRPANLPYSIAEIVAHLISNARFNLALIDHPAPQTFEPPLSDWPEVHTGEWEAIRQDYFTVLQQLREAARQTDKLEQVVYPATSEEPGW